MIVSKHGETTISGKAIDIAVEFNSVLDSVLETVPEIVIASFYKRAELLTNIISKLDERDITSAERIVDLYLKASKETKDNE